MPPTMQSRVLCSQRTDDEPRDQADKDGRVHRAGSISGFCKVDECRGRKQQRQNRERQDGKHAALRLRERVAPFEGVALIEEEHADQDTAGKAGQAQKRVEVAARESEDHAERAAEEHEASDHHEHPEHKAGHGRTAAARRKFLLGKCP